MAQRREMLPPLWLQLLQPAPRWSSAEVLCAGSRVCAWSCGFGQALGLFLGELWC
jgi:hypothetical protein